MTSKLTATLSDGREYEVIKMSDFGWLDGSTTVVLKPLVERRPREWWLCFKESDAAVVRLNSEHEAKNYAAYFDTFKCEIIHVREVL